MNHGWIERIEYRAGGGRYGNRAYMRIWVIDRERRNLCWVDAEAANYALKKRQRVFWRDGRLYWERSPTQRLVILELLGVGEPEQL
jgi:hypothetical protein